MDLTISIVNHSNPELLRECLCSIYSSTTGLAFEVWVIDNATGGRLVPEIRAEFPQVRWIFNDSCLGFSANHNQVLRRSEARHTLILNDDTVIHRAAFSILVDYLDANPTVGIVGPRLLNFDGSIQNSTFRFMTIRSELADLCLLPRLLERWKRIGLDPAQFADVPADVDWALGACLAIRREALAQIGPLDANLSPIANTEEVDWCYRAHRSGWRVAFVPAAIVTHFGGQSTRPDPAAPIAADRFRVEMYRTRVAFSAKHYGRGRTLALRLAYVVSLPYNLAMLWQGFLRGRLPGRERASQSATLRGIAAQALRASAPRTSRR